MNLNIDPTKASLIGIVTAAISMGLAIFNGITSYQIDKQKIDLEASKEKMARYTFVQERFPILLMNDCPKRTLTLNLIQLALKAEESKKLFEGLNTSSDPKVKNIGMEGVNIIEKQNIMTLAKNLNASDIEIRRKSYADLVEKYNKNSEDRKS